VPRKTLTKLYFCKIFLHLYQNELLGNNHGDAATGKSAAPLGHIIGMESEQIPLCAGVLSRGLSSPVSLQINCNVLRAKCPRVIFPLRKPWENVPSKYRRTFNNPCTQMTASTRRINKWFLCNLGKNTCRDTGENYSVDVAVVQQFFIE